MPIFAYTAVNEFGAEIHGTLEAGTKDLAEEQIAAKNLYVISLSRSTSFLSGIRKLSSAQKVKRKEIIEFAANLALMIRAGVPIIDSLQDIGETSEQKFFGDTVLQMKKSIEMGSSFSEALAAHKRVFPDILVRLVAIGEETGSLEQSLQDVSVHLQRIEDLVSAIQRALIYPAFALFATGGALAFWMLYVLPQLLDAFGGMGMKLPLITRILARVNEWTQAYWYCVPIGAVLLLVLIKLMRQIPKTRYYLDLISINLPILQLITRNKLLALFAEQFRILIISGITIDRALGIIAEVIGNEVFKTATLATLEDVKSGAGIAESLKKHRLFPPMVLRMIDIGEKSGSLDAQLGYLSHHYLDLLDDITDKFGKMLEPIIIMVIGLIFLIIIAGILLPVYDLITEVGM